MIGQARLLGCYNKLVVSDMASFLENNNKEYNVILAADEFIYIGELQSVFAGCVPALKNGGLFSFSIETEHSDKNYVLRNSGRYVHSVQYIQQLAKSFSLSEISYNKIEIRKENNKPINGYVVVLKK